MITRGKQCLYTGVVGLVMTAMFLALSMRSGSNVPVPETYSNADSTSSVALPATQRAEIDLPSHPSPAKPVANPKTKQSIQPVRVINEKPAVEASKYPEWWLRAWPRSAVASLLDVFVGDQPLFPPCQDGNQGQKGYTFVEPRNYLARSKSPCWYEDPKGGKGLRCAPYFYLAGVAKGGTTDLYRRIRLHPDVMFGTEKEYHWWDRDRYGSSSKDLGFGTVNLQGGMSLRDYLSRITGRDIREVAAELRDGGSSVKVFSDGSPSYLWDSFYWVALDGNQGCMEPRVITGHHIRHFYPAAKIILTFRHPTPRLYSRFLSRIPRTPEFRKATSLDFHKFVVNGVRMYRECFEKWSIRHCTYNHTLYQDAKVRLVEGMYPVFMADWLRIWPKEQMLILRYEDYSQNMESVLRRVFDFLDLAPLNRTQWGVVLAQEKYNIGEMYEKVGKMLPETKLILDQFYQPFIYQFAEIMNDSRFLWADTSH
nr:hypothetical protein BaRGS_026211 [Batillaria attramentaria]